MLLRLLLAHILSDFFLQMDSLNESKYGRGASKWKALTIHSLIHAATAYLLVARWTYLSIPVIIGVSHFCIDFIKSKQKKQSLYTFTIDQAAHLLVILLVWWAIDLHCPQINWFNIETDGLLKIAIAYALMLKPGSILINLLLARWEVKSHESDSLQFAGQWIGYIERVLILTFTLANSLEGVGFLLAAKSIFRFGALNKSKEIKATEYVLIGTMASFAYALLIGLLIR